MCVFVKVHNTHKIHCVNRLDSVDIMSNLMPHFKHQLATTFTNTDFSEEEQILQKLEVVDWETKMSHCLIVFICGIRDSRERRVNKGG